MLTLHVVPARGLPFEHQLDEESNVVGRSSKADLVVADRSLSRQHARLFVDGGSWRIEDLGSRNGTLVNRKMIDGATSLKAGDIVEVGASVLTIRQIGGGGAALSEAGEDFGEHTVFRPAAELLEDSRTDTPPIGIQDQEVLQRYAKRLQTLNEVHQALAGSAALDELLDLILDRAFEELNPEEGAIFLKEESEEYLCAASRSARGPDHRCLYSRNLIREVAEKGLAALVLDAEVDDRFNQAASILNAGMRSLVAAPLMDSDGALGMMVLGSSFTVRQFTEEDMELLVSLASVAAMRIRNVRLTEEAVERKRLDREVQLAREIQMALLPDTLPEVKGYSLHGGNLPSRGVSGDLFKVMTRGDERECVVFLADVSGKGIAASLLTASLEALIAGPIEQGVSPEDACRLVSRLLFERTTPEKYATGIMAVLESDSGSICYAGAGHNPGLLVREDGDSEWLDSTGAPLGILPVCEYTAREVQLEAGDTVILYTDGITEAENPDEMEYGDERLERVCVQNRHLPLAELAAALEEDLESFADGVPFADDRTVVMIRRDS
jgi:serine phosphatase RsbU (regulator of sigma subunit)